MPRKRRFHIPDVPVHIVQRGHSRIPVFFENDDCSTYLHYLEEGAERYGCSIHAYVLMTNHIHILATPIKKREPKSNDAACREELCSLYQLCLWYVKFYLGRQVQV